MQQMNVQSDKHAENKVLQLKDPRKPQPLLDPCFLSEVTAKRSRRNQSPAGADPFRLPDSYTAAGGGRYDHNSRSVPRRSWIKAPVVPRAGAGPQLPWCPAQELDYSSRGAPRTS